ncbi:MAG TPA: GIY-YIG nuclease family protein [Candidatus Omnitrophota bacterium]|nr:GIY-YIG nuclease family protein [Candidatus Omnitrophota bacterium]
MAGQALNNMYYVYVLENALGQKYIGYCADLANRLQEHNQNSVRSTKHKGPFKIVLTEVFENKTDARKREIQLKSFKGNSSFRKLLNKFASPSSSLV